MASWGHPHLPHHPSRVFSLASEAVRPRSPLQGSGPAAHRPTAPLASWCPTTHTPVHVNVTLGAAIHLTLSCHHDHSSTGHLTLHLCSQTQGGPSHLGPWVEHLQVGLSPWVLARQGDGRYHRRQPHPTRQSCLWLSPVSVPQPASLAVYPSLWWSVQSQARCS